MANRSSKLRAATTATATSTASVGDRQHTAVQLHPSSHDSAGVGDNDDGNQFFSSAPSTADAVVAREGGQGPPILSDLFTRMGKTSFVLAPHTGDGSSSSNSNSSSSSSVFRPAAHQSDFVASSMDISSGVVLSGANAGMSADSPTVPVIPRASAEQTHRHPVLDGGPQSFAAATTSMVVVNNDNFVRQNLKNRGGACRGARPKSSMAARHARIKDLQNRRLKSKQDERVAGGMPRDLASAIDNTEEGGYDVPSDYHNTVSAHATGHLTTAAATQDFDNNNLSSHSAGNAMHAQTDTVCSAASRYGLDPLQLSLDAIVGVAVLGTDTTKAKSSSSRTIQGNSVASTSAATAVDATTGKAGTTAAAAKTSKHQRVKKGSRHRHSGRYGGFDDAVLEAEDVRPACSGHQLPAKLITVRKDGPNKGRKFYGCSYPADQRCKFFMWAEDNPNLIALVLEERASAQERDRALGPEEAYRAAAVRSYCERLDQMSVPELKDEIRRCHSLLPPHVYLSPAQR